MLIGLKTSRNFDRRETKEIQRKLYVAPAALL